MSKWERWKAKADSLRKELNVLYLSMRDHRVPKFTKVLTALTIAYALSPIDLIPDFIPILGLLDDLIILPVAISLLLKSIPDDVISDCRKKVENELDIGWKKWLGALIVLTIWTLIIIIILMKLL